MRNPCWILLLACTLVACGMEPSGSNEPAAERPNPFFQAWDTPHGMPPYSDILETDFPGAFEAGLAQYRTDMDAIRTNPEPADFENTVLALETAGPLLRVVRSVFNTALNTSSTAYLRDLELEVKPLISEAYDQAFLDGQIFRRVESLYQQREKLGLDEDEMRLLTTRYQDLIRSGALLADSDGQRLMQINRRLSELSSEFSNNVLQETQEFYLLVTAEADLVGLSERSVKTARAAAVKKGYENAWLFGLSRPVFEGFMTYSERPELRREMLAGYQGRGMQGGQNDNREIVEEIARLRAEYADILGFDSYAAFKVATQMARSPEAVREFLLRIWEPAKAKAIQELAAMRALKLAEGYESPLEASDWWYYARKLRRERYNFSERELRPYFELSQVRAGVFYVANRLFGLRFEPLDQVPAWHPDVQAWEVYDDRDAFLGLYLSDDFARRGKRGGSWKSLHRSASNIHGETIRPIISTNFNLSKPPPGEPALLNLRDVQTLFHEFGHALQGLMTTVPFPSISGSAGTPRDYREFPSQFFERYATDTEVMERYARHTVSGEPMPRELMEKIQSVAGHNQGFRTSESIAAAMLDMEWHQLPLEQAQAVADVLQFENRVFGFLGPLPEIGPRYRSAYFTHVFSGSYPAGYYAYLWSEVLDADAYGAFLERGNLFDPELAQRLKLYIYEAGAREDADVLYRKFRGRDPDINAFLELRGLKTD